MAKATTASKGKAGRPPRVISAPVARPRSGMHFFTTRMETSSRLMLVLKRLRDPVVRRWRAYVARRPHRSLQLTQRRDLPAGPLLPGYVSFTHQVWMTIRANGRAYAKMTLLYAALSAALVGFVQQDVYVGLADALKQMAPSITEGNGDAFVQSLALFGTSLSGALNTQMDGVQQLYFVLLFVMTWLTVVWYLRQRMAGSDVRVRDALYQSGAPLLSTAAIVLIGALQSLPLLVAIFVYGAFSDIEVIVDGFMAMIAGLTIGFIALITLYFLTSTLLAMIIATIPGTYPMAAIRVAGDIAAGKRVPLTFRVLWLLFMVVVLWLVVLVPVILLSSLLPESLRWIPVIPVCIQILSSLSVLYGASYVYLLYRRMIDEPIR